MLNFSKFLKTGLMTLAIGFAGVSQAYAGDADASQMKWSIESQGDRLHRISGKQGDTVIVIACDTSLGSFNGLAIRLPRTDMEATNGLRLVLTTYSGAAKLTDMYNADGKKIDDYMTTNVDDASYNFNGMIPVILTQAILKSPSIRLDVWQDKKDIERVLNLPIPENIRKDFSKKCHSSVDTKNPRYHNDIVP